METQHGNRLKIFRIKKGFTKKSSFARFIKTTDTTISEIERGNREISQSVMDLLTVAFPDLNPDWLWSGQDPMLLTLPNASKDSAILNEAQEFYTSAEKAIKERDNIIAEQRRIIEDQRKVIEDLKDV